MPPRCNSSCQQDTCARATSRRTSSSSYAGGGTQHASRLKHCPRQGKYSCYTSHNCFKAEHLSSAMPPRCPDRSTSVCLHLAIHWPGTLAAPSWLRRADEDHDVSLPSPSPPASGTSSASLPPASSRRLRRRLAPNHHQPDTQAEPPWPLRADEGLDVR